MFDLSHIGELAFASRLKGLSERMYASVDSAYRAHGPSFQARWFPVYMTLYCHDDPLSMKDIAEKVQQTHASVSQIVRGMDANGLISSSVDSNDERCRLVTLSHEGAKLAKDLVPMWEAIRSAVRGLFSEVGCDVVEIIRSIEAKLDAQDLKDRISQRYSELSRMDVKIVDYLPKYASSFRALNEEWLRHYFYIEEVDVAVLSAPEKIIEEGGHILFAKYKDEIVGTCALIMDDEGRYELSKMAVAEKSRGLKIGRMLLDAAIKRYRESKASGLYLLSSAKLAPALRLYESGGFVYRDCPESARYARADVYMEFK